MDKSFVDIVFEGNKFSPETLKKLTGLDIEVLAEFGKIADKGRYKGEKSPYGLGLLKVEGFSPEDLNSVLYKTIETLLEKKKALKQSAVDEITLDLENYTQNEVEITINKEIIRKISELNASIDFSSIFASDTARAARHDRINTFHVHQYYTNLFSDNLYRDLPLEKSERIKALLHYKFDYEKIKETNVSEAGFYSALLFFVMKYVEEIDMDKIPTFEKFLLAHFY